MKKKILCIPLIGAALMLGCGKDNVVNVENTGGSTPTSDTDYDDLTFDRSVTVTFSASGSATVDGATDDIKATIDGNGVTIVNSGSDRVEYTLSGSTANGYLKIYSGKRQSIVLDGVSLSNSDGAAINVQGPKDTPSGGKAVYLMVKGSNNIADGANYSSTPDGEDEKAAIFAEGKLMVGGEGSLTVVATGKAGMASDDYVKVYGSTTLNISATAGNGLRGKDSVIVAGGTTSITVSADGKKGISTDGDMTMLGGTLTVSTTGNTVVSDGDTNKVSGIKADGNFAITGGTLKVTSTGTGAKGIKAGGTGTFGGGNVVVEVSGNNFGTSGGGGGWWGGPGSNKSNSVGAKGIKCTGNIVVESGSISVTCSKHEGIESKGTIVINGGEVYSHSAGDDAINAASDLTVNGGYVCGWSDDNDGLDANGNLYVKGGVVYAVCTCGNPEVALDAEESHTLYIQGGTLVAVGGLERGASITQDCWQASSWSKNTWYAMTVGDKVYAFQTPSSGNGLVVSGAEKPSLTSGATCSGGTEHLGGKFKEGCTVSGGSSVSLSQYSNSGGGWWW